MPTQFELFTDVNGQTRWRLKAGNREIVATSEGYTRKRDCERSVKALQRYVTNASAETGGPQPIAIVDKTTRAGK